MDDVPSPVPQDLDLNVSGLVHVVLNEHLPVSESAQGFGGGAFEIFLELVRGPDHAHAPPSAPVGGLDDDRVAYVHPLNEGASLLVRRDRPVRPGHHRNTCFDGQLARLCLVAECDELLDGRAHKDDPILGASSGEIRVFREQAIPRVDGIDAVAFGSLDYGIDV
jgi:hypothetical protein